MESKSSNSRKEMSNDGLQPPKDDRDFYITHPLVIEYRVSVTTHSGHSVSVSKKDLMSFSRVSLQMIFGYMRDLSVPHTFTV